jgi:CDP-diacylglycerol---glycerol-3-phosphate 3-phosphatidyltransferase
MKISPLVPARPEAVLSAPNTVKRHLPFALTTLRLALGPVALLLAWMDARRWIFLPLLVTGTLSDIFDGILARRYGVATPALRRYDSITDVIYYLFLLGALWRLCEETVRHNLSALAVVLGTEAAAILVCAVKFGKYPATHSWLAKFYGLCLLGGLIALLAFDAGNWAIICLAIVAAVTNGEIILLHLLARTPPVDVPSLFHRVNRKKELTQH